jgi:hypothetical protein
MRHIARKKNGRRSRSTRIDCEWGFHMKDATQFLVADGARDSCGFDLARRWWEVIGVETISGVRTSFIWGWASYWQP